MLTWLFLSFCGTFRLGLTTLSPDRRASSCQSGTGAPGCSPRRSLPWPSRLPEIQKLDINRVNASMTYLNWWKPMETYGNCHDLSIFRSKIFKKQIDFEDQHQNDLHDSMDILYIYIYRYPLLGRHKLWSAVVQSCDEHQAAEWSAPASNHSAIEPA